MIISSAQWVLAPDTKEKDVIKVVEGGVEKFLTPDSSNGDYLALMQQVSEGSVVIAEADPIEVLPRRVGTPREFLELFSEAEQAAFFAAESANVELKIWWAKASTGNFSLDHPSVAVGLAGLVAAGILSQERSNEILASDFDQA